MTITTHSTTQSTTQSTTPTTRATTRATAALDDLRDRVAGTVHAPGDPTWDHARMAWAVAVDQQPMAVLEARDAHDVQAAVRWAVDHDCHVTAQPVGHGATRALAGGLRDTLLLRTRALDDIWVDVGRRTATVGAGVKAGELCTALEGTGLTFLCGSNPDPSVVGMTITGGISWFGRAYGLGADSIVSVDLVDGLGRLRHLSATEDPELFWAVRGGGGDFGIITSMEVALHPAAEIYGGRLLWPVASMRQVLEAFRAVTRTAPPELTLWFHVYQFPPLPEVPEPIRGRSFASVAVTHLGPAEDAEALLAPFRAVPGLAMDLLGPVPISALGTVADEPTEPMPSMEWSTLLTDIDDGLVSDLTALVGEGSGSPLPVFQIRHLGGTFRQQPAGQGAFGSVVEEYSMFALGVPAVPELVPVIAETHRRLAEASAHVSTGRALLNFLGADDDPARWWSPEVRARLTAVKGACDPLSTIRSNRPVTA